METIVLVYNMLLNQSPTLQQTEPHDKGGEGVGTFWKIPQFF